MKRFIIHIRNHLRMLSRWVIFSMFLVGYITGSVASAKNLVYLQKLQHCSGHKLEHGDTSNPAAAEQKLPSRRHLPLTKQLLTEHSVACIALECPGNLEGVRLPKSPGIQTSISSEFSSPIDRAPPAL